MALPQIIQAAGRTLYKDARGRWISKSKFELLSRKDPATGRFLKAGSQRLNTQRAENILRTRLGAPPRGMNWVQIAAKYKERFADFLEDI